MEVSEMQGPTLHLYAGTSAWTARPLSTIHPAFEYERLYAPEPTPVPEDDTAGPVYEESISPLPEVYTSPPQGDIEGLVCGHWPEQCGYALCVFHWESGPDLVDGNPYDVYVGTAQIDINLHGWRFQADPTEPTENLRVAREMYDERGWGHWPTSSRLCA